MCRSIGHDPVQEIARFTVRPGRSKSDVSDCQWLQYLHSVGLLRAPFRPDTQICAIRSLSRHRASLVQSAAVHVQHMHKALTQMNLQIHHLLSDITGISGMAIIEAIVAGERDPVRLAALCDQKVRSGQQTVIKSNEDRKQAQPHENRLRKQASAIGFLLVPIAA